MMEVMLDSGSSVSLIQQKILSKMQRITKIQAEITSLRQVTASGDQLPMLDHIRASVILGELKVRHDFVVVEILVSPVILGVHFLQSNALVLDFEKAGSILFSTLDLQSGYWQLPINPADREKTVFALSLAWVCISFTGCLLVQREPPAPSNA